MTKKIVLDAYSSALSQRVVDDNGFWNIEKNPIARAGVMEYTVDQLPYFKGSEQIPKDKVLLVLKSPEGFQNSYLDSLKGKPIIVDHYWLGADYKDLDDVFIAGNIGDNVVFDNGVLYANIYINSKKAQDIINAGCNELSVGSTTRVIQETGDYQGEHYDYVMFHEVANHVGIVQNGRCGKTVKVLDVAQGEKYMSRKKEIKKLKNLSTMDEGAEEEKTKDEDVFNALEDKLGEFEGKDEILEMVRSMIKETKHVVEDEETKEEKLAVEEKDDKKEKEEKTEDTEEEKETKDEAFSETQMRALEDTVRKIVKEYSKSDEFEEGVMDSVTVTNELRNAVENKYGKLKENIHSKKQIVEYVALREGLNPTFDSVYSFIKGSANKPKVLHSSYTVDSKSINYKQELLEQGRK